MTAIPGKLTVGADGRLRGPASIDYNHPWPCPNGNPGVTGRMRGALMHTMVGNSPGTIATFNNTDENQPGGRRSAHFAIAQDGTIHQFFPLGQGYEAWHAVAANLEWYGIEHADDGDPRNPLTHAQMVSSAQLVECLSAFAGFPLQVTNVPSGRGYGTHAMGGLPWGGHTCPDVPDADGTPHPVRSLQRAPILMLAKEIRGGVPHLPPLPSGRYTADGHTTLAGLAQRQGCGEPDIIWSTARAGVQAPIGPLQRRYVQAGRWDALIPAGTRLWLP